MWCDGFLWGIGGFGVVMLVVNQTGAWLERRGRLRKDRMELEVLEGQAGCPITYPIDKEKVWLNLTNQV